MFVRLLKCPKSRLESEWHPRVPGQGTLESEWSNKQRGIIGRINYWMRRNVDKKWWMGVDCQEREGVSEAGCSIQRVGFEGLRNSMRGNEWSIYRWRRREHSSSTYIQGQQVLTWFFACLVCLQHIPSCLSQHSSFITASLQEQKGYFNPVKDILVAAVNEARRLALYQSFPL